MSLMRRTSEPKYEDIRPLYVYLASGSERLTLDRPTPEQFTEIAMRALEQSDELSEDELEKCHHALRTRLRVDNE